MENLSQNEAIRKHLEAGNEITPLDALRDFDCMRLGARILDLKNKGLSIVTRMVEKNGKRFASYKMFPEINNDESRSEVRYRMTENMNCHAPEN